MIGADLMVNEITAHARAAVELDPAIDTIIEIGGQDSKFTDAARRAGDLRADEHGLRGRHGQLPRGAGGAAGVRPGRLFAAGPRAARRRCERPVHGVHGAGHQPPPGHGYTVEEILAAALHSVCENYLLKVAPAALIGETICFQGATARNRALVAAFEQRLGRPIFVSRYCHLTGALGVALCAWPESPPARSRFRGIGLYREDIPVPAETCGLCANHCRLSIAEVQGENGGLRVPVRARLRDPPLRAPLAARTRPAGGPGEAVRPAPRRRRAGTRRRTPAGPRPLIGLPAALHLAEDMPLWERFFAELGRAHGDEQGMPRPPTAGKEVEAPSSARPSRRCTATCAAWPADGCSCPCTSRSGGTDGKPRAGVYLLLHPVRAPRWCPCRGPAGKRSVLIPVADWPAAERPPASSGPRSLPRVAGRHRAAGRSPCARVVARPTAGRAPSRSA